MRAGDPSCHCPAFQSEGEGRLKKDDPEPKNRMLKAKKKKQSRREKRDDIANVWGYGGGEGPWGEEEDIMEVLN